MSTTETSAKKIVLSEVLALLNEGKSRKEIGAIYGLKGKALQALFQHKQLKGRKVKTVVALDIEDDVTGTKLELKSKAKAEGSADASVAEAAPAGEGKGW